MEGDCYSVKQYRQIFPNYTLTLPAGKTNTA
jgi:hypothetical protein